MQMIHNISPLKQKQVSIDMRNIFYLVHTSLRCQIVHLHYFFKNLQEQILMGMQSKLTQNACCSMGADQESKF